MSYQSLEDKIVKSAFSDLTTSQTPAGLPMELPGTEPEFEMITRRAEKATEKEIEENSRAAGSCSGSSPGERSRKAWFPALSRS